MEVFSLLKYWRGGGGGAAGRAAGINEHPTIGATTIAATIRQSAVETDEDDDDEGSFFDLELPVPDVDEGEAGDEQDYDDGNNGVDREDESDSAGTDGEGEVNFAVSSGSNGGGRDPNLSLSPSDDLFFKARVVPLEPSSETFSPSEQNSKSQFPVSLLKSATKLRVFMLKFKKPKSMKTETGSATAATPKQQRQKQPQTQHGKFFTVKLKVEEVPIVSLFTRENSSRRSSNKLQKQSPDETASDEKRFLKDVQKYMKMIKPLYVNISRRYGEKLRFSGQLSLGKAAPAPPTTTPISSSITTKNNQGRAEESKAPASNVRSQKQGNLPPGLRVVCKHLGKSRSASSAVAAMPPVPSQSRRQDDSLLQVQDGIQNAILHCKRSLNATGESETSLLSRCASDPSHEKLISSSRNSSEEGSDVHFRN